MQPDDDGDGSVADRDVIVPLRVYKTVVVFSTLFAVGFVVAGFMALDTATQRANAPPSEVDVPIAALGIGLIAAGGLVYAFASRFRAPGMGTTKTDDGQRSDDG